MTEKLTNSQTNKQSELLVAAKKYTQQVCRHNSNTQENIEHFRTKYNVLEYLFNILKWSTLNVVIFQNQVYFSSKMHRDQEIRLFIFILLYPFGGIFTHQKMKKIRQNQKFPLIYMHTQLNMRIPKKFKEILLLWYALLYIVHCTLLYIFIQYQIL